MDQQDIIAEARKAFPRAPGDLEAVCLMVSYLNGCRAERLLALNLNAQQVVRISQLGG